MQYAVDKRGERQVIPFFALCDWSSIGCYKHIAHDLAQRNPSLFVCVKHRDFVDSETAYLRGGPHQT